ncbi:hypothetical protein BDQ12DRAFT_681435 [Crucibulum laeve]|uniref:Cobalamin-independent methionine synthase MetE C-terminal/archaeal domain-containing protein n=1 Tax=Crucibulum laeve TaxID=68775 RepID=A0A5C3M592_9AGAR|nr:hypothetical protein BDQ12DRAFT_681435 [Crucibulum laeve]
MSSPQTLHIRPPFRAEHIGSFFRPATLYQKRELFEKKECSREELRKYEDEAIKEIVQLQKKAGVKTITDGEMRRGLFFEGIFDKIQGMKALMRPVHEYKEYIPHVRVMYANGVKSGPSFFCDGKLKRTVGFYTEDFKYLKSLVEPEEVKHLKVTMGAPNWIHQRHGCDQTYDLSVYKNDEEYFTDLGIAYREEVAELYALGCRHIQIDNPTFCYFCDETMIAGMKKAGLDPEAQLDAYIHAMNLCTQGRPVDLTMGVHMCRGNYRGMHYAEGGYDRIAVKLFNDLDVDTFYLEYDTERAGDFAALKHLPPTKSAVLGLMTTKNANLETVEELKTRITQAVDAMCSGEIKRTREEALNQLCISTQCGFASAWQGNPITEEDQLKKLQRLVETAQQVWKE